MLTCLGLSARNWRQQVQFNLWADRYAEVAPQQHIQAAEQPDHMEADVVEATEADVVEATEPVA